jgi:hypothetical protein
MNTITPTRFRSNRAGSLPFQDGVLHLTTLLCVLACWPESAFAQGTSATLLTTFTNPTPASSDTFGSSLAAFGSDRLLIGADGGGAAYLFGTSGTLLTTFSISDPAASGFGYPVAAVGGDGVLIGAYSYGTTAQNGRAYLFRTNGSLQTTFTNPAPATVQAFGLAIASLGNDSVLIGGLPNRNSPAPYPGGVFLFTTNGTLLATFNNPAPAFGDTFGLSVAAVGSGRVLIGAPDNSTGATRAGVAYLFNTNGALLLTITNPVPVAGDNFGWSVAAVGNNRVLISAIDDGSVRGDGAAYLFSTNGTLLTTFAHPTPTARDSFGSSVAAVGSSRVLIGAYGDDTGAANAGSAYLFSTNGTLLNTFTNPTPASFDNFGWSVAAVGTDRVLIGALLDNTGAPEAGAAYLFDLPYPSLSIARSAATVSIRWVAPETGLRLQESGLLGTPTVWEDTAAAASVNGPTNVVQQLLGTTNRFYRLRRP